MPLGLCEVKSKVFYLVPASVFHLCSAASKESQEVVKELQEPGEILLEEADDTQQQGQLQQVQEHQQPS